MAKELAQYLILHRRIGLDPNVSRNFALTMLNVDSAFDR